MSLQGNPQLSNEKQDSEWIRQSMFIPVRTNLNLGNIRASNAVDPSREFTYSVLGFADTSLGGNKSINPKPQFTKFADQNVPSLLVKQIDNGGKDGARSMGMGRIYGETFDANAQRIYIQYGVPAYNSLSNFFTMFYDIGHGTMANSGVNKGLLFNLSKWTGMVTIWAVVPELATLSLLLSLGKKAYADIRQQPLSKFYYMKPAMASYWSTVTTIMNALAVNMQLGQGVTAGQLVSVPGSPNTINQANLSSSDIESMASILPDIWLDKDSSLDVRGVANRYQRLAMAHQTKLSELKEASSSPEDLNNKIDKYLNQEGITLKEITKWKSWSEYISEYARSAAGTGQHLIDVVEEKLGITSPAKTGDTTTDLNAQANAAAIAGQQLKDNEVTVKDDKGQEVTFWTGMYNHLAAYSDFFVAELQDGSNFISFIVDYDQHAGESISNSSRESSIAAALNSQSREQRSKFFNLANGNILDNVVINTLEGVASMAWDVVTGLAASAGLSGIAALGGRAFVDIPEFWDTSTTTFQPSNYTIKVNTPFGSPDGVYMYICFPLACWLAAAAPKTTGRNSYTGPYLCKLWQPGRMQFQLGLVSSLSISRGSGASGWNIYGQATAIDLNISIINLSKILHVPIVTDLSITDLIGGTILDESNNYTDYMAVLAAMGVSEQYYASSRWAIKYALAKRNWRTFFSPENLATWYANETIPGSIMGLFARKGSLIQ